MRTHNAQLEILARRFTKKESSASKIQCVHALILIACFKRTSLQLQIRLKSTFHLKIIRPSESVQTFFAGFINRTEFWVTK